MLTRYPNLHVDFVARRQAQDAEAAARTADHNGAVRNYRAARHSFLLTAARVDANRAQRRLQFAALRLLLTRP